MWKLSEQTQKLVLELDRLLASNSWFGRVKREHEIVTLLGQIGNRQEPAAVAAVARCLFHSAHRVRITASTTIHRLLSDVLPVQLIHLSDVVGSSWQWYISHSWDQLRPKDVAALLADSKSQTSLLGLLSFHRNGHVRQEAVRMLDQEASGDELPYLIIRQNDWVAVIAEQAQNAVRKRMSARNLPHFVRCLALVVHLLSMKRQDLSPVVRAVVRLLIDPENDSQLAKTIRESSRPVRRSVARMALDIPGEHRARVIHHGLTGNDPVVRWICARQADESLSWPELRDLVAARLRLDKFMPVRREGLVFSVKINPEAASTIWKQALLDPHASVRELARYEFRKLGAFDAAAFYRQRLRKETVPLAAANGLAECGDESDLPVLRELRVHSLPSYRRAAIRGIARIAKGEAVDDLVSCLRDDSPSVVGEARKQLETLRADLAGDMLYAVATEAKTEHARLIAVQLIFRMGKWQSLPWLIRLASTPDEATVSLSHRLIEEWFSPPLCNKVFSKPSGVERQAIEEAMRGLPEREENDLIEKLTKWLKEI